MTKSIQLIGAFAILFVFTTGVKAQTLQEQMFEKFGTITKWMNTPLINSYIEESAKLDKKFYALLDEPTVSDSEIVPVGKVVKGKNVILLYLLAEYTNEGVLDFFYLHSVTLNKKTGENIDVTRYMLAGGTRGGEMSNGSFKLKEKGLLVVSQNVVILENENETTVVKEYEFGKALEYIRTID
jgi:hypothetical protein